MDVLDGVKLVKLVLLIVTIVVFVGSSQCGARGMQAEATTRAETLPERIAGDMVKTTRTDYAAMPSVAQRLRRTDGRTMTVDEPTMLRMLAQPSDAPWVVFVTRAKDGHYHANLWLPGVDGHDLFSRGYDHDGAPWSSGAIVRSEWLLGR
ncbi:MAG TPA: hypothetical protein VG755_17275 [Nannocystaceae bacterium]|nr:hypothetical protein [Nannocystaceae bacterium]